MIALSEATKKTLDKVSREFESEVLTDLEGGRTQSLAQLLATRNETAETVSKILETSIKQAESLKRQIIGAAELESRNYQLRALEVAVNEVFGSASKQLAKLPPSLYEDALTRMINEGIQAVGRKAVVSCNAGDKKIVASAIRKLNKGGIKLTLDRAPIQTIGGVTLTTPDGAIRFDNTFEARLERLRPILRKDVANLLRGS